MRPLPVRCRGFGLVEFMMAIAILGIIAVSLATLMQMTGATSIKSRQQTEGLNFSERFFTRLNNIPYPYVFAVDSSSSNYGLTGTYGPVTNQISSYPYVAAFDDLKSLMKSYKLDRFTLDIKFMVRDTGDVNGNGSTTDLRYYTDNVAPFGVDDYDPALRYYDQNGDGDFRDTYITTGTEITEEPDTHLKEATLKVYDNGKVVYQETRLISWEKLTGAEGKAAGATLQIVVTTPSENSAAYQGVTAAQNGALNLVIRSTYPSTVLAVRADTASVLHITGETSPNATLSWKLQSATNAVLDTCSADVNGNFDCAAANVTANLVEGSNKLWGQATKTVYYSPWSPNNFIYDVNPPAITAQSPPVGTVIHNLQPLIQAQIADNPVTAGRATSGINPSVITMLSGTTTVNSRYDPGTGYVTWIDSATGMWPVLPSTGTYTIVLEGGDNAFYKTRSTWTFTVDVANFSDGTNPQIPPGQESPRNSYSGPNPPTITCRIFDNQSGINPNSIVMTLDGTVVVSSATGNLMSALSYGTNPQDDVWVTYQPPSAVTTGMTHVVTITASHWANNPANQVTAFDSWTFTP